MKARLPVTIAAVTLAGMLCGIFVLYVLTRTVPNAVLMYHAVSEPPAGAFTDLFVSPEQLEAQLKQLKHMGYVTGFASEFGGRNTALLTFDDGYADFYYNAYPLFLKYKMRATVFVISAFIGLDGYLDAAMLREMADSGYIEIQSHCATHTKLTKLDDALLGYELSASRAAIEAATGRRVYAVCYPFGDYNARVIAKAGEAGYTVGFTTRAPHRLDHSDRFAIPRCGVGYDCTGEAFEKLVGKATVTQK